MNGEGILVFINNHSFLDNPTFRVICKQTTAQRTIKQLIENENN